MAEIWPKTLLTRIQIWAGEAFARWWPLLQNLWYATMLVKAEL